MQSAQSLLLKTVEGLLEENEIDKAVDALLDLDEQAQADLRVDILQHSGIYKDAAKSLQRNLISYDDYSRYASRARFGLLELIKEIPEKLAQQAKYEGLETWQFLVADTPQLNIYTGKQSNEQRLEWLAKAQHASKAIGRIELADGKKAMGIIGKDGVLYTANTAMADASAANGALVYFGCQLANGIPGPKVAYHLDTGSYKTDAASGLVQIKILDRTDAPVQQWSTVDLSLDYNIKPSDMLTVGYYPLTANSLCTFIQAPLSAVAGSFQFTAPGIAPGAPLFDKDWRFAAFTLSSAESAVQKAMGVKEYFNPAPTPSVGNNPVTPTTPSVPKTGSSTIPSTPTPAHQGPTSGIPKFVMVYDIADENYANALGKHLKLFTMTKKIRLYKVHEALAGSDTIEQAKTELSDANFVLALVTVNLISSDDWFPIVYDAIQNGMRVIPIKAEKTPLEGTGLENLKSLPSQNRSLSDFPTQDAAYADIVSELRKLFK